MPERGNVEPRVRQPTRPNPALHLALHLLQDSDSDDPRASLAIRRRALRFSPRRVQSLILSPTRELASQTDKVVTAVGDFMSVQTHCCVGGKSVGEDIRKLEHGVHVVSGTPGRVYDMIKRRALRTKAISLLVLDEADEMLSKGFKEQIYDVYRYLPPETQVVLISATLPREVLDITHKFMTDPLRILVKRDELTLEV